MQSQSTRHSLLTGLGARCGVPAALAEEARPKTTQHRVRWFQAGLLVGMCRLPTIPSLMAQAVPT